MLLLTNYLLELLHLHFGLLYRLQIFTTSFYCFIELAHLQLAQSFVIVKPPVSTYKARALVASLSHSHELTENFVGFVELPMLEITRPKIEFRFVVKRGLFLLCLFMKYLLEAPDCLSEVTIFVEVTSA